MSRLQRRFRHWIKIETYWNVNQNIDVNRAKEAKIKIETYWNVNTEIPA